MQHAITLTEWAKRRGVSKMTAWRLAKVGKVDGARLNPVGRWVVDVDDLTPARLTIAYARVSSHSQRNDLDRQVARIAEWAAASGLRIDSNVREIGSGLNDRRKELSILLSDPSIGTIVVEHRDRLARFGVGQVEQVLKADKRSIVVIDKTEIDDDLVRDMIDLMTSMSARLYGKRSARNRAMRAVEALKA